ncbi:MAG: hypothetical protein QF599_08825, partial [Planctomycetota bacterium]|nr:hypothetical protein [Planctomycetota bacterium]
MITLASILCLSLSVVPNAGASFPSGKLDVALDAIRSEYISADLHFIASDDLGGRDTPSAGLRTAARFIRARLMRLGFAPGARDGFFYTYELGWLQANLAECGVTLESAELGQSSWELGRGYYLERAGDFADQEVSGPVIYGGDGGRGDVGELALEGKWVLLRDRGRSLRLSSRRLRESGASGMLVVPAEDYSGKDYDKRFERVLSSLETGRARHLDPSGERAAAPEPGFPVLYLDRMAAAELLAGR